MEVEILSIKLVKPSSPTLENLRRYKISFMDLLALPIHVPMILYYHANGNESSTKVGKPKVAERIKKLEESLSRVLHLYYPLAGRYDGDKHVVLCNNEGAQLVEAKVSCRLSQILDGKLNADELNALISLHFESPSSPHFLAVQLNIFECGGMAIGIAISHRLIDGSTANDFINGWAVASHEGDIGMVDHPNFELASLFPARDRLPKLKPTTKVRDSRSAKMVTKTFVFNGDAIASLKAKALSNNSGSNGRMSRVEVVTALVWKAFIKANQAKNCTLRPSLLNLPVNLRNRIWIPTPKNSFGNFVILSNRKFIPADCDRSVEFCDLVHLVHDAIRNTIAECAKMVSDNDLLSRVVKARRQMREEEEDDKTDICKFAIWSGFPFYGADFGWGKPVWLSSMNLPVPLTILVGTKDGNGIEGWVNLEQHDMLLFQQDPDIVAFAS